MNPMNLIRFSLLFMACALHAQAQFAVTISPVKLIGQKVVVQLAITNNLAQSVESARAVCFLLDGQGKMVGQSSKWIIGGTKDRAGLQPKSGTQFNFVISSPQSFSVTNLTAKVSISRVVLGDGRLADVKHDVSVTVANTK